MAQAPLTVLKGGINRLRDKGGARADWLYDLLNGYLTKQGTVKVRPGTRRTHVLPEETRGLVAFQGRFHTFSHMVLTVPDDFTLHVLVNPDQDPGDPLIALEKIHFAKPMLGYLYVVAEYEDESVYHFWLQQGTTWAPLTVYYDGDLVQPTVVNGLAYMATRVGAANPVWTAGAPRTIGDIVEPTVYNGYYYTVVDTAGTNPASGDVEPDWPTEEGAQIVESIDTTPSPTQSTATDPSQTPGSDVTDRYNY